MVIKEELICAFCKRSRITIYQQMRSEDWCNGFLAKMETFTICWKLYICNSWNLWWKVLYIHLNFTEPLHALKNAWRGAELFKTFRMYMTKMFEERALNLTLELQCQKSYVLLVESFVFSDSQFLPIMRTKYLPEGIILMT